MNKSAPLFPSESAFQSQSFRNLKTGKKIFKHATFGYKGKTGFIAVANIATIWDS